MPAEGESAEGEARGNIESPLRPEGESAPGKPEGEKGPERAEGEKGSDNERESGKSGERAEGSMPKGIDIPGS